MVVEKHLTDGQVTMEKEYEIEDGENRHRSILGYLPNETTYAEKLIREHPELKEAPGFRLNPTPEEENRRAEIRRLVTALAKTRERVTTIESVDAYRFEKAPAQKVGTFTLAVSLKRCAAFRGRGPPQECEGGRHQCGVTAGAGRLSTFAQFDIGSTFIDADGQKIKVGILRRAHQHRFVLGSSIVHSFWSYYSSSAKTIVLL